MRSMEILGRLICEMTDEVEKLNDLLIYTQFGIESGSFAMM